MVFALTAGSTQLLYKFDKLWILEAPCSGRAVLDAGTAEEANFSWLVASTIFLST